MQPSTITRRIAVATAIGLLIAACGDSDDESSEDTAPSATEAAEEPADEPVEEPADEPAGDSDTDDAPADEPADDTADEPADDGAGGETGSSGSYEPGDIAFRSINLLDRPVDIYVRTTGLVEAFPIEEGVAPGAVTEYAAPPAEGSYLVTEAGAGDPTCVVDCDHFITNPSGAFGEGPTRTVLLYEDEFSGPSGLDLSEETESVESAAASGNLLRPADPTTGLVFPIGIALDPEVFGFRVSFPEVEGCVDALDQEGILVGGNQTPAYPYPGDNSELQLFEQPDQECATPVGSFPIDGGPGTRTLVALQGGVDDLTAITVELSGSVPADASARDDDGDTGDTGDEGDTGEAAPPTNREEFVEALLEEAPPGADAQCVADIVNSLSDADFQVIIDNIDAEDIPADLSPEGLEILQGIVVCAP